MEREEKRMKQTLAVKEDGRKKRSGRKEINRGVRKMKGGRSE